jgi:hypothetical protein
VIERRLQRAFALLSDTGARRISDLASDAGFPTSRPSIGCAAPPFGDTPSAIRGAELASGSAERSSSAPLAVAAASARDTARRDRSSARRPSPAI